MVEAATVGTCGKCQMNTKDMENKDTAEDQVLLENSEWRLICTLAL